MAFSENDFTDKIELAVRRVQTQEGAKKFGQPIGTIITPDMMEAAKKSSGGAKDTSKSGSSSKLSPQEQSGSFSSNGLTIKDSSISGPNSFKVGTGTFSAPKGSKLIRSKGKKDVAYVLTPDGKVHAFNASGEVEIPDYVEEVLSEKFSNLKKDDTLYSVEEFDEADATSLADQKMGAVLSIGGEPAFTKVGDDIWEHSVLGVTLTDDDLQPQFDSGKFDLQPSEASSGTDFSKMTADEIAATLDGYEVGKEIFFKTENSENATPLVKLEDGTWKNKKNLANKSSGTESKVVASTVEGTNWLSEKSDPAPNAPEVLSDPLSAETSGKTKDQRLTESAEKDLIDSDYIVDAGISGAVAFHKKQGMLVKREEDYWETEEGVSYSDEEMIASADAGTLSNLPWNAAQEDSYNAYQEEKYHELLAEQEAEAVAASQEVSIPEDAILVNSLEDLAPDAEIYLDLDHEKIKLQKKPGVEGWSSPNDDWIFTDEEIQLDVDEGSVFATPDQFMDGDISDEDAEAATSEHVEVATEPNTTFGTLSDEDDPSSEMTSENKKSAIEALESHSGFQVKYGLKSLPDSHPLKNEDILKTELDSAKEAYPDLPPKKALLAYLKGEKPTEPLADWEKELLAGDSVVHIGSHGSPKKVVQGLTGGTFTQQEVQQAVDILENYEGKQFKNALVQKGNPLGALSPNDIIGFEKDKLVGKQKYIDFLKGKLAKTQSTPEAVEPKKFSPDDFDFKNATLEDIEAIPEGTTVYFDGVAVNQTFTKTAPNTWTYVTSGEEFDFTDDNMKDSFNSDEGWSFDPPQGTEEAPKTIDEAIEMDEEGLLDEETSNDIELIDTIGKADSLPVGSVIVNKYDSDVAWTKTQNGMWTDGNDSHLSTDSIKAFLHSGNAVLKKEDSAESGVLENDFESGHVLISSDKAKKVGGQAGSNEGGLYELETPDGVKKFYVKKAQTEDHGKNEALANALYKELGVNAPNVDFASDGNLYSEIVDGKHDMDYQLKSKFSGAWKETLQKDFAIDAWLSNRDVFGMTYDNILTDADGNPWKIDNGGALKYRAMGSKKDDFTGDDVPELEIFKTGKKSVIFGEGAMTKEQELDGVNRLAKLSPERIDELVAESGMDSEMADILKGRREYILKYYGVNDPYSNDSSSEEFNPNDIADGYVFTSVSELEALNPGQKFTVEFEGSSSDWIKQDDGDFKNLDTQVSDITAFNLSPLVNSGWVKYKKDSGTDLDAADSEKVTLEQWQNDPVGTEYTSPDGHYKYKKTNSNGFGIVSDIYGESSEMSPGDFKTSIKNQYLHNVKADDYVNGIGPGKYNTGKGAKAHLYVKPDGTGIYVGMKGIKKELDAEGVKKNYDAGMNVFSSFVAEGDYPDSSENSPTLPKAKASKIIPTLGDVSTLPDGTYDGPAGVTYTVKGDEVIASKAVKSMDFTSIKVGQIPDGQFLEDAPVGTQIAFRYYKDDQPDVLTKNEDGEWKGSTYAEGYLDSVKSYYAWAHKKWKVHSFPGSDDSKVTKASLKSKYLQGQLVNPETRSSVIPVGYSGSVTFFDGPTDIASLASYRDYLKDTDIPVGDKGNAHNTYGVPMNVNLIKDYIHKKHGVESSSGQEQLDYIIEELDEFLVTAKVPAAQDFSQVFQKDEFDAVPKPLEAATAAKPSWYDSTGVWTAHIKTLSATVGDGSLIGANMAGAKKDDKTEWVGYFNNGDFDKMYQLELAVAKSKGKTHPTGNAHPGHPDNKATHKIKWSAAVKGEVPAGTDVPGNWSSLNIDASLAELDNYLILAKMQNPTHLSNQEKRTWVNSHRKGQKGTVDALSAQAALRAKNNEAPLTEAPQWADDVKPAKIYDSMFDDTEFPQTWTNYGNLNKANEFYSDHVMKEPELASLYDKFNAEDPYNYPTAQAVQAFFAAKQEAYLEELNKPVWEVKKTISEGSHPTFIVKDQKSEKMKIFKPTTTGKEWRADNEVAAHNLGSMLGFNVPGAVIGDVNEGIPMGSNNKGIVMDFAPNVGSLGNVDGSPVDLKTLTPTQFGQLAKEHVFDWFLDNDDTHDENMLIGTDGNLVAIDKGRAFLQYGHWHGLDVENPESLNVNTKDSPTGRKNVVYADMINAIKSGNISQEQLDEAYKQALRAAKRVQKSDNGTIEAYVKSATANRENWDVPTYAKDWDFLTPNPTSQDELVEAVLNRKNSMVEDFEEFYDKLYKAAGFFKPEPPAKALGEDHLSGWEEADVLTKTEEAKVWGAAPIHGSAAFADGASLLWTEKDTSGNSVISGKIKLGNITQQKVMDFMAAKISPYSGVQASSSLKDYPTGHVKQWKKTVTQAGKDISANATSGNYDQDIWDLMKVTEGKVDTDLAHAETIDISDGGSATFPSGVTMPTETVPMYVMALNYHKGLIANVEKAKAAKETTDKSHFQDFNPPSWKIKGMKYISPEGWTYKELDDGNYVEVKNGVASVVPDAPDAAKSGAPGWTSEKPDVKADTSAEKYTLIQAGMFAGQLNADGEKIMKSDFNTSGHPGKEYRIDLPTGEKIFFRDGDQTGTVKSQTGTVRFQLNRLIDSESSLSNVQDYLQTVGLDMSGADEEQVENVYWRQMFGRLIGANASNAPESVQNVRNKLIAMKGTLSTKLGKSFDDLDIPEAVGLTEQDERTFWMELATEAWGAETVNEFLNQGKHLPKYQHMDINDPEKATGLPWYQRIDVDLEKLYAKGTMLAHGNNGKDARHFDYIKSGAYTSTEERLRILGFYKTGASSSSDQGTGGANYVFTRVANGQSLKNGSIYGKHVMYWSPEVMSMTGTYSYSSDQFGNLSYLQNNNKLNPLDSLNYTSGGNETMVPNNISVLDFMEIMVFESENERLKAIQEFKKRGIEKLRGLPIEDRLVLRTKLDEALKKVKGAWK